MCEMKSFPKSGKLSIIDFLKNKKEKKKQLVNLKFQESMLKFNVLMME